MRSSRSAVLVLVLVLVLGLGLGLAACGTDESSSCSSPVLAYDKIGAAYFADWCRGCHGADVPPAMRQRAPAGMDFDTVAEIRASLAPITQQIAVGAMPPAGGPSDGERELVLQWLACGAP